MQKNFAVSLALLAATLSLFFPALTMAASGISYVPVTKCEQVGADVKLTNFGTTYNLVSSCRNAGYGLRQYKLTCVDANNKPAAVSTKYKVEWVGSCVQSDTITPIITLNGSKVVAYITDFYGPFVDPGAKAIDNKDGDITNKIKVTSNFNVNEAGIYQITYQATDAAGNTATATRTVLRASDAQGPQLYSTIIDPVEVNHKVGNYYYTPNGYLTRQGKPFTPTVLSPVTILYNDNITGTSSAKLYSFYDNANTDKAGTSFEVYHIAFGKVKIYDGTIKTIPVYFAINTVNVVDAFKPIIMAKGPTFISIKKGETYVDPGVTVESPTDPNYTLTTWIDSKPTYGNYYYIHDKAVNKYGSDETVRTVSFNN